MKTTIKDVFAVKKPRKKPVRRVFGRIKNVLLDVAEEAVGPVVKPFIIELTKEGLRLRKKFGKK